MVDGAAALGVEIRTPSGEALRRSEDRPDAGLACEVVAADAAAYAAYALFARDAVKGVSQSPLWVESWAAACNRDIVILRGFEDGRLVFALPLEVVASGPFHVARYVGGQHANGNFGAMVQGLAHGSDFAASLSSALSEARPDIDVLLLERQFEALAGLRNPLLALPSHPSSDPSLVADLGGGFEALLERTATRKRKRHRAQARKLAEAGEIRRIQAATPEEVDRLLGAFFAMKAERFRAMGIPDVFGAPEVRAFFELLFTGALSDPARPFRLHGLEVGGTIRAVTGSSLAGDRLVCEFGAISDDELAAQSPGDFLFFENIAEACEQGLAQYDFSVGDENYKRLWCEIEVHYVDSLLPLTARGRLYAAWRRAAGQGKRLIKASGRMRHLIRVARRRAASLRG